MTKTIPFGLFSDAGDETFGGGREGGREGAVSMLPAANTT